MFDCWVVADAWSDRVTVTQLRNSFRRTSRFGSATFSIQRSSRPAHGDPDISDASVYWRISRFCTAFLQLLAYTIVRANSSHVASDRLRPVLTMENGTVNPDRGLLQVVSGSGEFNDAVVRGFMANNKLDQAGVDYQIIAITGPQSSGKSTLLNHVVGVVSSWMPVVCQMHLLPGLHSEMLLHSLAQSLRRWTPSRAEARRQKASGLPSPAESVPLPRLSWIWKAVMAESVAKMTHLLSGNHPCLHWQ